MREKCLMRGDDMGNQLYQIYPNRAEEQQKNYLSCWVQSNSEILEGDLYFCLEERKVCVSGQEIELTAKEFDALRLLIMNRKRVLTFEMISYQVWGEEYIDITVKIIHNLMGRLRQNMNLYS